MAATKRSTVYQSYFRLKYAPFFKMMEILLNTLNSPPFLDCISRIENNFNLN